MKYIVFSFDDGRRDFFVNALPILKKYNLTATVNVISDSADQSQNNAEVLEYGEGITWDNAQVCLDYGVEIAGHSANHTNDISEIIRGCDAIKNNLKLTNAIGFASPHSGVSAENFKEYKELIDNGKVSYIRSGNQLKRDGSVYALLYLAYKYTKSSVLFYLYNKRNIIQLNKIEKPYIFFPSITCNSDNNIKQLLNFIDDIPDNSAAVIMFHSILDVDDPYWKIGKWATTISDFEKLCSTLSSDKTIKVITNSELYTLIN